MKKETINEFGEKVISMTLEDIPPLTDADREMIREACKRPPVYDEDCPPMSEAMLKQMDRDIEERWKKNRRTFPQESAATA